LESYGVLKIIAGALAAVVILGALGLSAEAQINPFRRSGFELTQADIDLMTSAGKKLLPDTGAAVGTVETWSNPESGTTGTVQLVGNFEHKNLPCQRLQYDIKIAKVSDPFRYIIDRCQIASGEWKQL
jgi:hypothetical protein